MTLGSLLLPVHRLVQVGCLWGMVVSTALTAELPEAFTGEIDFRRDIAPILESKCVKCHGKGKDKGGFNLDDRQMILQEADSGPAVEHGNSGASYLVELVAGLDPDNVMPQKGSRLTDHEVSLIRAWIDRGLPWDESISFARKPSLNLKPRRPSVPEAEGHPVDAFLASYFEDVGFVPPEPVGDRTYARRVYLDIIGLVPPVTDLKVFLADRRPDKRERLVGRLLADRQNYAEHWLTFWNDLLRNDYRGTGFIDGGRKQISSWLYESLACNLPYDAFVRSLVTEAPGAEGFIKGIIWRGVVNASQAPTMQAAQNVSQVFMGVNLKCASCHDSFVNDWSLNDAYGMASIFAEGPMEMFQCDKPLGKTAQVKFLHPELGAIDSTAPRRDRMEALADLLTKDENGRLSRTIVNRLWAKFFGRGLVPTLDDMEQPSWHPELLDWLAADLVDHGYDLKQTMSLLLTSNAYRLPSQPVSERLESAETFRGPWVRRMTAEQFVDALGSFSGRRFQTPANSEIDLSAGQSIEHRDSLRKSVGHAKWIAFQGIKDVESREMVFRKRFRVNKLPTRSNAHVAADDSFELFVNGERVGRGNRRAKVFRFDIQDRLVKGSNLIALKATKRGDETGSTAAFALISLSDGGPTGGVMRYLGTDDTWISRAGSFSGWAGETLETFGWSRVVELGDAAGGLIDIESQLVANLNAVAQSGTIRASLVASDPLTRALGRPNREQVVTDRRSHATTLQALELTNGVTLAARLSKIAADLLEFYVGQPSELVEQLFWTGLGRGPTPVETEVCSALFSEDVTLTAIEDILWAIVMLPEFQLIL
ncbi:MAG: hypothetical protein M2R45_00957 [Verrucomicrobia subdivision 3 bacterium]|nr:hypothetical protein [Limisphaerales bacterium]MCS1414625.1 hypothetical protein [Limisphaerales bacterium]